MKKVLKLRAFNQTYYIECGELLMVDKQWETDEDEMIYQLQVHKHFIGWVISRLEAEGIPSQRTRGNDSRGDIFYQKQEDEPRVKEIVRGIYAKYNK